MVWMIPFLSGSWWLSLSHMGWPVALVLFAVGIMLASLAAALWTLQVSRNDDACLERKPSLGKKNTTENISCFSTQWADLVCRMWPCRFPARSGIPGEWKMGAGNVPHHG